MTRPLAVALNVATSLDRRPDSTVNSSPDDATSDTSAYMEPDKVKTRQDLIDFLREQALTELPNDQEGASTATELLEAMAAWLNDATKAPQLGAFVDQHLGDQPTWRGLAELIAAGRVYE